ncbi:MAG: 4-alpha-glucanotransferase [Chloroflexi bacterium]|jgi:4-alpha-glucanotransferase|nr:4-alpha-glucanotransferase [Chloroflexota bacterium]
MRFPRSAGVLAHPTSFPGRYGIGDLGGAAYHFIDFLVKGRQSLWQILPLGPTGYGDSPYQSFSAFAGNPLLISPDKLVQDGYLPSTALEEVPPFPKDKVDYGWVIDFKRKLLLRTFEQFQVYGLGTQREDFEHFCAEQASWLDDFAMFMALKNYHVEQKGGVWNTWPLDIARRQPQAITWWKQNLADEIRMHKFLQYLFFKQWLELKSYANERGIRIVGDIPIFVAFDSADVWANSDLFYLNEDGSPAVVAGVPPDYFSETGQRWGNPLYRWHEMSQDNYSWWTARLKMSFTQVDVVRIDHFRGFDAYWEIPASEPTAVIGKWIKGPGQAFFETMEQNLDELPLIAEDLGLITPEVIALRDRFHFPGMKILQFAFGGERNSLFLPHNFSSNCVVYTGTHDNETTVGWFANASEDERRHVLSYMNASGGEHIAWDLIRLAYASVADTAVATLQDLMNLDNEARMNYPGRPSGNWQWRHTAGMLSDDLANALRELTELYGRVVG